MCYSYGAYSNITLSLLEKYDVSVGLSTEVRVANLKADSHLNYLD
jgi:hypothetical protein